MTIEEIKRKIATEEHDFLCNDPRLGDNIAILGLGGSYAYGTNTEMSDIDIRGVAVRSPKELLTGKDFEVFVDTPTDTVVYSLNRLFSLLQNCNPNAIEILGLKPEHYLKVSEAGQMILDNKNLFLSKRAAQSFGGYARAQLVRLQNKSIRNTCEAQQNKVLVAKLNHMIESFSTKYGKLPEGTVKVYEERMTSDNLSADREAVSQLVSDIHLNKYPVKDFKRLIGEMTQILRNFESVGGRNQNAINRGKLEKHMMHLVRLYYMSFDILESGKIVTYREDEHDLLMEIREGCHLNDNGEPTEEFYEFKHTLDERLQYAEKNTSLPDQPNSAKINELLFEINKKEIEKMLKGG